MMGGGRATAVATEYCKGGSLLEGRRLSVGAKGTEVWVGMRSNRPMAQ
jgi:hypothetical protein